MDNVVCVSKLQTSLTEYQPVPDPATLYDICLKAGYVEVDTETTEHTKLYTLQLGTVSNGIRYQFVIERNSYPIEALAPIFSDKKILKILQNAKYDHQVLNEFKFDLFPVFDTFIAEVLLVNGYSDTSVGLAALVKKYCNQLMSKEIRGKIIYLGLTDEVIEYAARDVRHLHEIYTKQKEQLVKKNIVSHCFVECQVTKAYAEMEQSGIRFDTEAWNKLYIDNCELLKKKENEVNLEYVKASNKNLYIQGSLFSNTNPTIVTGINWNSPQQIVESFKHSGFYLKSSGEADIAKIKNRSTLAVKLLEYKKLQTLTTKFGKGHFKFVKNGRIYFDVWQCLDTMRVAMKKPNISQIPQDNRYRNCFMADEGWSFIDHDYMSQELHLIAIDSKDPTWLNAIENGYDLHSVAAELVFKDNWKNTAEADCAFYNDNKKKCNCKEHKVMRTKVKTVSFCLVFGGGASKVADILNILLKEGKEIIDEYFEVFPALKKYFDNLKQFVKQNRLMRSMGSIAAIRHFDAPKNEAEDAAHQREGMNARIQTTGACIMKYGVYLLMQERPKQTYPVRFVMTQHDAIITTTPNEHAEHWSKIQKELMIKASQTIVPEVFIGVDASISPIWKK